MPDDKYVLDANVFMEAAERYYAFDLVPAFWDSLINLSSSGQICSIDHVKNECSRLKNELTGWVNKQFSHAFDSTDEAEIVQTFGEIMNWVNSQTQFTDAAKADFARGADGWLIAFAIVNDHVVVTHEIYVPDIRKKVPIPNVCQAFNNKRCIDTFVMLRELGVQFR
ncbi:MAG: DUF4411 family protein [Nitrospinota bacterium]